MNTQYENMDLEELLEFAQSHGCVKVPKVKKKRSSRRVSKKHTPFTSERSMSEVIRIRMEACEDNDPEKDRIRDVFNNIRDRLRDHLEVEKVRLYVFVHDGVYMIRVYMKIDGHREKAEVFPAEDFMASDDPFDYVIRKVDSPIWDYEKKMRTTVDMAIESESSVYDFVDGLQNSWLLGLLEENSDLGNSTGEGVGVDIFTTIRINLRRKLDRIIKEGIGIKTKKGY